LGGQSPIVLVDVVAQPRNHYDYDWGEAERRFRAAVKREPLSTHLRQWYASFWLLAIGRPDEALLQLARVMDEDPLCQMWHYLRSGVMECLGRPDDALAALRTATELDPKFWLGPVHLGMLYATRGQHAEAMHCAEKAMAAASWSPYSIGLIAGALAKSGQAEEAEPLLVTLRGDWYGHRSDSSTTTWRSARSTRRSNGRGKPSNSASRLLSWLSSGRSSHSSANRPRGRAC